MGKIKFFNGGASADKPLFAAIMAMMLIWAGAAFGYEITFDPNGGSIKTPSNAATPYKVTTDGSSGKIAAAYWPEAEKTGENFDGWYTRASGGDKRLQTASFSSDATLYAQYTYTITFEPNGGNALTKNKYDTGTDKKFKSLPTATRTNATFAGWYTLRDSPYGDSVSLNYTFNQQTSKTLYAQWTSTVTFNASGGTVTPTSAKTGYDGKLDALPEPEKTDAVFDGWWTAASGGEKIPDANVYIKHTTIYAHWIPVFTITFNPNGGIITATSAKTNPDDGTIASFPDEPTYTGYTFDGWWTSSSGGTRVPDNQVFKANTTIYAHWKIIPYTITFIVNPKGGVISPAKDADETGAGWKLKELPKLIPATGYSSGDWYTTQDGNVKVTTSTVFSGPAFIYARWVPTVYSITYNLNGGIVTPSSANPPSYTIESESISLKNPTKAAHAFTGWTGTGISDKAPETNVLIPTGSTGAKTYTANWEVKIYNITFYDDDTTIIKETGSKSDNAGKIVPLPTPPAKSGYTFDGWYTDNNVKITNSTVFEDGISVSSRWIANSYQISYSLNGGTVEPANPTNYTIESSFSLNAPTRIAYEFTGWTGTGISGTTPEKNVFVDRGNTGPRSYVANWSAKYYNITFDPNGGTVKPDSATTMAGGTLASLPTPVLDGYLFEGWFTDGTDGEKITTYTVFEKGKTIYAHWTRIYTVTFNANGGFVSPLTANTGSGGKLTSLPKATKPGQALDGWFTAETDGMKITKNTVFGEDMVIYAHWADGYNVTFSVTGKGGKLKAEFDDDTISSGALVPASRSVVFTALPETNYKVGVWTVNGEAVANNTSTSYTLSSLTAATTVTVSFNYTAVASPERVIPGAGSDSVTAAVAPAAALAAEFAAGPNPVGRSSGAVNFFRSGSRIESAALSVYDASGNAVTALNIGGKDIGGKDKRAVGSWDLRDKKGRLVPEGTYLVKGVIKTAGGKREQASVILSVGR